jgi:hypothetical protein
MATDWIRARGYEEPRREDWYDQAEVCLNGHVITWTALSDPSHRQKFCQRCGEKTIDVCPGCGHQIRGHYHSTDVIYFDPDDPPKYCVNCGAAFPWQGAALENLQEILKESSLTAEEISEFEAAIPDIVRDTPKTQSATLKLRRLLPKVGGAVYDVTVKVITDIASETAKKTLGL